MKCTCFRNKKVEILSSLLKSQFRMCYTQKHDAASGSKQARRGWPKITEKERHSTVYWLTGLFYWFCNWAYLSKFVYSNNYPLYFTVRNICHVNASHMISSHTGNLNKINIFTKVPVLIITATGNSGLFLAQYTLKWLSDHS